MDKVEQIDKEYRNILGDQPVFWYLLAVGVEISNPRSNGRAGNDYYTTARQLGPEYYHAYCTYLHAELTRRHEANPTQMVPELCSQYWTPLLRVERELQKLERQPTLVR